MKKKTTWKITEFFWNRSRETITVKTPAFLEESGCKDRILVQINQGTNIVFNNSRLPISDGICPSNELSFKSLTILKEKS